MPKKKTAVEIADEIAKKALAKDPVKIRETVTREYLKYSFTEPELKNLAMGMAQSTI